MRREEQIDLVLYELLKFWKKHPELRLGQIIANTSGFLGIKDSFYLTDKELYESLKKSNTI